MSKTSVAARARSPKTVTVVPIRRPKDTRTPSQIAETDNLAMETELMTWRLKGLSYLLDAWVEYEHRSTMPSPMRAYSLGLLGFAAEQIAERLETRVRARLDAYVARPTRARSA